jgi:uncharacterized repeat protein (TIGR01451 family)
MIRYLAIIVILFSANLAASFAPADIEWAPGMSGTLAKGGTLVNGEYMVKAVQFPSGVPAIKDIHGNIVPETDVQPSVLIEIYKNGVLLSTQLMTPGGDPYIDPDYEVKITATDFPASNAQLWVYEYYSPWATISIQKRGVPKLDVTVTTDKGSYTSYDDTIITATATVTNSGDARAENVDLDLDIAGLQLRGGSTSQLHQNYYTIEKGASQNFSVILEVPQLLDQQSYILSANATGLDVKDLEYNGTNTCYITVSPKPAETQVVISKAVKDHIYLQDPAYVSISVGNGGVYELKNITVIDSVNENFELISNTSLQWVIPDLKPGQNWGTTYSIKALGASLSGFSIPTAIATFTFNNEPYTIYSQPSTVVVYGPEIIVEKTVDKPVVNLGEDVTVTVNINNVGNIVAYAAVNDSIPEGSSLVNGTISLASTSLELNTPETFSYTMRMNKEGEIELPSAVVKYIGSANSGMKRSTSSSEKPVITVINPSEITSTTTKTPPTPAPTQITPGETIVTPSHTATPEPASPPSIPGFNIAFAFIVLIVVAQKIINQ